MTFDAFVARLRADAQPVVLLEGTRALAPEHAPRLSRVAERLARALPHARFRTGNAPGSDSAFAEGVARVDAQRLEYVLPYPDHRVRHRPEGAATLAVTDVAYDTLGPLLTLTREASPQYRSFTPESVADAAPARPRAVARLIVRDTLKVTGTEGFAPPAAAIFYVNPENPTGGGTGHTLRVCERLGVPALTQAVWGDW